ncbi:energy transducer TonB [Bradyrhizobium valentinum]|uniref:Energy transducer TonB n=1 Tax=Bradyrhizobium valentinum TaxID=1518501 RepID=A0A0R3KYA8_9BRAD|nr:energy transducer TonB [Bradyrhizobium valentinum]KRQ90410.1 energy transducer TonB [Bradyrhizobium valentinum]KRR00465.1 energy transducer TonB [Bradyrhizobium valentinum]
MSFDEIQRRNQKGAASLPPGTLPPYEDEPGTWSSGEILRLFTVPALATLLLVGGVYWIRLQTPSGSMGQQQASVVQVHLLPRPDAAPIVTASTSHSSAQDVTSRTDISPKEPSPSTSDEPVPVPRAFSPAEAPPSNILSAPSAISGPADSAAAKFQQALLRHVAQYQRYPNAARALRLQGKVDTQFSMSRDGKLLGVWVRTSSGQTLLDKEAMETIRRAQPLPPIPPELPERLNIHVQLVFDPS